MRENSLAARASPKTPLGGLQHSPDPLAGGEGRAAPSPRTPPLLSVRCALDFASVQKILAMALAVPPVAIQNPSAKSFKSSAYNNVKQAVGGRPPRYAPPLSSLRGRRSV